MYHFGLTSDLQENNYRIIMVLSHPSVLDMIGWPAPIVNDFPDIGANRAWGAPYQWYAV